VLCCVVFTSQHLQKLREGTANGLEKKQDAICELIRISLSAEYICGCTASSLNTALIFRVRGSRYFDSHLFIQYLSPKRADKLSCSQLCLWSLKMQLQMPLQTWKLPGAGWGGWLGVHPQAMSTHSHFWVNICFEFQSLCIISNTSTADPQFF